MPRGGKRSGTPGVQYPNRGDMQQGVRPVAAIPGQQRYGAQADQIRAQQVVPSAPQPMPRVAVSPGASTAAPPAAPIPLDAPTMRPNEPVTAGVNVGPGPGAPTPTLPVDNPLADELRALYMEFPYPGIRELLEDFDG